jgi:hypothetical protein
MVETIAHHEFTMILIYDRWLKKLFYPTTTRLCRGEDHGRGDLVEYQIFLAGSIRYFLNGGGKSNW